MDLKDRFEQLLHIALDESVERADSELKTEEELRAAGIEPHQFSPAFERKMKKLICKQRRAAWRTSHRKAIRRTAASFALFIAVCGITIAKVDAIRVPVMSFIINLGEKSSEIVVDQEKPSISKEFNQYLPTYTPDGFTINSLEEYPGHGIDIEYVNENGDFYWVSFALEMSSGAVDTENAQVEERKIQGSPALISEKEDRILVVWGVNGHSYSVIGYLSKKEAIKILESVKLS